MPPKADEEDDFSELDSFADLKTATHAFKARLAQESKAKREARERNAELEKSVAEYEKLKADHAALMKAAGEREAAWNEERAVLKSGITDDTGILIARTLHGRLPEKDREPFPDWLQKQKADPTKADKGLRPYLVHEEPAKPASGKGTTSTTTAAKDQIIAGGGARAMRAEKHTPEEIRAIYEEAQRTNDWSAYKAARDSITSQVMGGAAGKGATAEE